MKTLILAAGTALLSVLACAAPGTAADPQIAGDVEWTIAPAAGGDPHLRIRHASSSSDVSLNRRAEFRAARDALGGNAGPVAFTVAHEAGTLTCSGRLTGAYAGEGRCHFSANPRFEAGLAARGLTPRHRTDLIAMLLVDATLDLADGLTREGVKPKDSGDLIAAAALDVTPAYVHELRSDAMVLSDVEDAIACKALDVDGPYVRGLAAAGYRGLTAEDVVAMKAMDVTPAYAQAMNRARGSGQ
jgi:hypothetical protein